MAGNLEKDPLLEVFVFETLELIGQLENIALDSEETNAIESQINEVFRIVHTVKGSAAMMSFDNIATLSHSLEDAFYYIREENPKNVDYSALTDVVLRSTDFIKNEINEIRSGNDSNHDVSAIAQEINAFLTQLKNNNAHQDAGKAEYPDVNNDAKSPAGSDSEPAQQTQTAQKQASSGENRYKALITFEEDCGMENIRAFNVVFNLEKSADIISYSPSDISNNPETAEIIKKKGFELEFSTDLNIDDVKSILIHTFFVKDVTLEIVNQQNNISQNVSSVTHNDIKQSIISVNLSKLDNLMDLVGELVITQAMVVQNPDLKGLSLDNFTKAARQLQKVTNDIQDSVMSIRLVSLTATFQKMHRIVRDMSKKLNKGIKLEMIGQETEVDKNIIEHLSNPLIHLIRNAADHGIESTEEREKNGKDPVGKITLEAKNEGGDVKIIVKDDGRGLDRDKILEKAKEQGLIHKPDNELTDTEIYSCIFLPGFSTNEQITEFSGRGVGMDVVHKNIDEVGGEVLVDSTPGIGTIITIKIPLTLAIIDGMKIRVGNSSFVIPITSIRETLKVDESSVIRDEANNTEMMMIRGECFPILRLHDFFKIKPETTNIEDGIIIAVENKSKIICLYADELLGKQQVVVKALPRYIKKIKGISGCTVMGDGSVCLIIDVLKLSNSA